MKVAQALLTSLSSLLFVVSTNGRRLQSVDMAAATGPMVGATQDHKEPWIPAVKSYLSIQIPHRLHHTEHQTEPHNIAHFGLQVNRGSMTAAVYYIDESLCWLHDVANNTYPSRGEHDEWVRPFFILAKEEGHCTPVRMARNAQHLGAEAVILAERICRCDDNICKDAFPHEHCMDIEAPLVNDGSGGDVSIPTILMHKTWKLENLTATLMNDEPVMMEFIWGLPLEESDLPEGEDLTDFKPHYHLWTSAHDPLMKEHTYEHLKAISEGFGNSVHFSPRFAISNGRQFGCHLHHDKEAEDDPCHHLCTNGGRYCATHFSHVAGKEIIKETLRRICIYETYKDFPQVHKFYDYNIHHLGHCSAPLLYNDTKCIDDAYNVAKIAKVEIDMCMQNSGGLENDVPNGLLETQLKYKEYSNVVEIPSTIVKNGMEVHTTWTGEVFIELCKKFWDASAHNPYYSEDMLQVSVPEICNTCGSCSNVIGCVKAGHCVPWGHHQSFPSSGSGNKKGGHGWFIAFLIFAILIAGAAYYYYKQREQYGESSVGLLNGYMQMSGRG